MKHSFFFIAFIMCLTACQSDKGADSHADTSSSNTSVTSAETAQATTSTPMPPPTDPKTLSANPNDRLELDLSLLKTGVAQADLANYAYPFAVDSVPVQNYANAYQITTQEAQHAMTLAMASPEALNKVLDMIVGEYVGHSLTDGKDMSLVVYTTDKVVPTEFDYVIADKFGEGLVLPVKIIQATHAKEKPQVDAQAMMERFHSADENNAKTAE